VRLGGASADLPLCHVGRPTTGTCRLLRCHCMCMHEGVARAKPHCCSYENLLADKKRIVLILACIGSTWPVRSSIFVNVRLSVGLFGLACRRRCCRSHAAALLPDHGKSTFLFCDLLADLPFLQYIAVFCVLHCQTVRVGHHCRRCCRCWWRCLVLSRYVLSLPRPVTGEVWIQVCSASRILPVGASWRRHRPSACLAHRF
jgi:hypothetical protein